jgi:hypothetical protein
MQFGKGLFVVTFSDQKAQITTPTLTLGAGKVVAPEGPTAAPQLAAEIVKRIRASRPLPSAESRH